MTDADLDKIDAAILAEREAWDKLNAFHNKASPTFEPPDAEEWDRLRTCSEDAQSVLFALMTDGTLATLVAEVRRLKRLMGESPL